MIVASNYSAFETLPDGRRVEIRALRPEDRAEFIRIVERSSALSIYRRFFRLKRYFSEQEIDYFTKIDFIKHVALVAVVAESDRPAIVGGGRYVVIEPDTAEIAFAVIDQYQRQGLGGALLNHLIAIARAAGLKRLAADVLAENAPMLALLKRTGLPQTVDHGPEAVHVVIQLI
jgi:GNAT superfamily N-acetyltransferase